MDAEDFHKLNITGITVVFKIEDIWNLSFDGISSTSFMLLDHIFHLFARRYELSVAIYLRKDDAVPEVMPLFCKLCMMDNVGRQKLIGEKEVVVEKEKEFVLLQSVMIRDLENQKAEFLSQDTLTLSCSLSSSYRLNLLQQQRAETEQTINCFETLSSDLENLYKAQTDTDVLLKTENAEIPVHRALLCARCPNIASMLNSESPDRTLEISNLPSSVLQDVLHYIYTGKIRALTAENVVSMLSAAHSLSLDELKEVCMRFVTSCLTEENVFEAAVVAHEYENAVLREEVEQFLVKKGATILKSERWRQFCAEKLKCANEIMTAVLLRMQKSEEKEQK